MTNEKVYIDGYDGLYSVDREGNVWSLIQNSSRRKGKLKPYVNTGGYLRVNLYDKQGKVGKHYVHRLVAKAFIPNPLGLSAVNHINADKTNNTAENLEWCDAKYNVAESRRLGLQKDFTVIATGIITGEIKTYRKLKDAAIAIGGNTWAFGYLRKKNGNLFYYGQWRIEVMSA